MLPTLPRPGFLASRHRVAAVVLASIAILLGGAETANANLTPLTDGRARIGERSLDDVGHPERREARLLLRDGLRLLLTADASDPEDAIEPDSQVQIEQAIERFDRAARVLSEDPELGFYRALALARFVREEAGGRRIRRTEEAIAELLRVRALAPDYEPGSVAWELALLHARANDHGLAADEYGRVRTFARGASVPIPPISSREEVLLALFHPPPMALVAINQAEVEMLAGRLSAARGHYDEAVSFSERGSIPRALALFGRALVEERAGAHLEALATALEATTTWTPNALDQVAADLVARHGPLAALHHPGVSFEPRWEIHAYEALAHEARARAARASRLPDRGELAATEDERALRSLRAFFAVGGEASPHAAAAREALARLERQTGAR